MKYDAIKKKAGRKNRYVLYCVKRYVQIEFLGEVIMSSKGNLILAIIWIILSPAWFWAENTAMGIIWLCAGVTKLIIALIRRNKEKKSK